jgi:hypothetical protein
MRFEGLSYGELKVLSLALLQRFNLLSKQLAPLAGTGENQVVRDLKTQRRIVYELLLEVGNERQDHSDVDKAIIIDV